MPVQKSESMDFREYYYITHQCLFIYCNIYTILIYDVNNRRNCMGQEGEPIVLSAQFFSVNQF